MQTAETQDLLSEDAEDTTVPRIPPEEVNVTGPRARSFFKLLNDQLVACDEADATITVYNAPTIEDKTELQDRHNIDFHTLQSSLDPDELARLEFETDHAAIILKRPRSFSAAEDDYLLKLTSTGIFISEDHLVVVMSDDAPIFEGRVPFHVQSSQDVLLRLLYQSTLHFQGHLKTISMLSDSLEQRINTPTDNKYLLNMFALEKSLVYIVNAISSNGALLEKMRAAAEKLDLNHEQSGVLEDLIIENQQCIRRAEIFSQVVAGLMETRTSIMNNNLHQLLRKFTLWTIAILLANLVLEFFSINVPLPLPMEGQWWPFWIISLLAAAAGGFAFWLRRKKKW